MSVFFVVLMAARLFAGPLLDGPVGFAIAGAIARVAGSEIGVREALLGADALVVALVWWTVLTGLLGATPGKALLGLRVRRADGRPLGLFRGLLRTVAYAVSAIPLGLGFLAILLHPRGRAFHDIIGGSVVVWRSSEAA